MKKHIFNLFTDYTLAFYLFTGIACASDSFEDALDSLFSSMNRTVEPAFNDEFIFNPNTFNYDLNPIDPDPWQTEIPFAPEAFAAFDTAESIPILELDFSSETTSDKAQAVPLAPTKTPARDHACTVPNCDYATAVISNLKAHMLTHTGERPYKCTAVDCNYAAAQRANLTRHMFTHTGEKPHKCPESGCIYTAARQETLTRHMLTHTGERPFKCKEPGCIYTAATKSDLTRHILVHTGEKPHKCPEPDCDYTAIQQSDLTRHMFIHTGEKPYNCEEPGCNYTTAYQYHLTRHMRNRHTKANPAKRQRSAIEPHTEPVTEMVNPLLLPDQAWDKIA